MPTPKRRVRLTTKQKRNHRWKLKRRRLRIAKYGK